MTIADCVAVSVAIGMTVGVWVEVLVASVVFVGIFVTVGVGLGMTVAVVDGAFMEAASVEEFVLPTKNPSRLFPARPQALPSKNSAEE